MTTRPVRLDNPITDPTEDALDRRDAANSFARNVLRLDASKGAVVAVFGPWGSGKTSFLTLVEQEIKGQDSAHLIKFNPRMFSNTEQLVERFFETLSTEIKALNLKDLRKIGRGLNEYGDVLRTASGPVSTVSVVTVG